VSTFPLTQVRGGLYGLETALLNPSPIVVIKGTQVYDSSKGKFADLSILDVLQVFGRAGRPGMETSGEGYICTTEDRLAHYLDKVTSQVCAWMFHDAFLLTVTKNPIESKLVTMFDDPTK